MRVLLTGSAGFIGSTVHARLSAAGHEVVPVDLMRPDGHDVRRAASDPAWPALLAGVDVVCHQAALVGVETSAADLPAYASHNDVGTASLLAAMTAAGVGRLVLASSMVVYGEGRYACATHGPQQPGPRPVERLDAGRFENVCRHCGADLAWLPVGEDEPLRPRSGYAAGKVAQEHYAAAWARLTGGRVWVNVVTGRDSLAAYGDGEADYDRRYDRTGEFLRLVRRLWTEEDVTFTGEFFQGEHSTVVPRPAGGHVVGRGGVADGAAVPGEAEALARMGLDAPARMADRLQQRLLQAALRRKP